MAETIRFPFLKGVGGVGPSEASFVIDIFTGQTIHIGGEPDYVSLAPWKIDENATEAPFPCVAIEFMTDAPIIIGTGSDPICLFGEIDLRTKPASAKREMLGVLGTNFAGTTVPQIPIVEQADTTIVGYSQVINLVACYDALSIGTLLGNLPLVGDDTPVNLIVTVRPIRRRDWMG